MQHYTLNLQIQFMEVLKLDKPFASVFRGAFGMQLRQTVCHMDLNDACETCDGWEHCPYVTLFSPLIVKKGGLQRTSSNIGFDFEFRQYFHKGEVFRYKIELYDEGILLLDLVKEQLRAMGDSGLGPQRAEFSIVSHSVTDETDYPIHRIMPGEQTYVLTLRSPLRILKEGKLIKDDLTIFDILRSSATKLDQLGKEKWGRENLVHFDTCIAHFKQFRMLEKELGQYEIERFSTRTKHQFEQDGVLGYMVFEGPMDPFTESMLQVVGHYGIGKNTVMGYGRFDIQTLTTMEDFDDE